MPARPTWQADPGHHPGLLPANSRAGHPAAPPRPAAPSPLVRLAVSAPVPSPPGPSALDCLRRRCDGESGGMSDRRIRVRAVVPDRQLRTGGDLRPEPGCFGGHRCRSFRDVRDGRVLSGTECHGPPAGAVDADDPLPGRRPRTRQQVLGHPLENCGVSCSLWPEAVRLADEFSACQPDAVGEPLVIHQTSGLPPGVVRGVEHEPGGLMLDQGDPPGVVIVGRPIGESGRVNLQDDECAGQDVVRTLSIGVRDVGNSP